jgi:MFS family permease
MATTGLGHRSPYRWVVLAAFMLACAVSQLMWLAYASIGTGLQHLAGLSGGQVVLLSTVFPLLYIPLSIPAGQLIDRYGFRLAVMLGTGLTAAGALVRMASPTFGFLLAGSAIIAVGQPFILNGITKLDSAWFGPDESAKVNGLFTVSLFAGMTLALVLTPALFDAFGGLQRRSSLDAIAVVYAALSVLTFVLFGLLAKERPLNGAAPTPTDDPLTAWTSIKLLVRTPGFTALLLVMCAGLGALIAFLQLIEAILQSKGVSDTTAGALGGLFVVAAAVGSFALSALSDRYGGTIRLLALTLFLTAGGLCAMAAADRLVVLAVAGMVTAAVLGSTWPMALTLSEKVSGSGAAGMAASLLLLVGNLAGVVWTFVMEQLHQSGGHGDTFTSATLFLAIVAAAGIIPTLHIRLAPGPDPAPVLVSELAVD